MQGVSKSISGFDPRSVVGCSLWLDAADAGTISVSGSSVTQWTDKSGGPNATQTTAGNRPTFTGSGVVFNAASSQFMTLNTPYTSSHTIFIVATPTSASQVYLFGRGSGVTGSAPTMIMNYTGTQLQYFPASDGSTTSSYGSPITTFVACYVRNYGTSVIGTLNGTQVFTSTTPTSEPHPTVAWSHLGQSGTNAGYYTGTIYEFLIYSNALSTTQRQSIEGYLAWKWGLQVQTPVAPVLSPLSISGCALWLDGADQSSTSMTLSGSSVTTWKDKSGNGRDLTASGSYPTITSNGVLFNGATPNVLSNATAFTAVNGINSFVVFNSTVASSRQRMFMYVYNGQKIGYTADTTYNSVFSGTVGGDGPVSYSANTTYLYGGNTYSSSPFISHSENGVETQYPSTYTVNASTQTQLLVGGQSTVYFTGTIKEVILYDAFITTTQRQSVENYLMGKWGIKPSLPATHPFYSIPSFSRPFQPIDVPGCALWLDGADPAGTGIAPTNNTSLATWVDKSGNTRNASASSAATYTSNGISFSSGNYYTMNVPYSSNYSIFLVATNTSVAQCYFFGRNSLGGGRFPTFIQGYIGNGIGLEWYEGNDRATISTTPSSPFIASVDHTQGTNITGWYNGSQAFSIAQTQGYATNAWDTLGQAGSGANYYAGYMKEIIFFGSVLTASQRQQVEGYLAAKWGLLTNLPGKTLSPLNIPGCVMWLDAADTSTLMLSTNNVTQWRDKSGSGNNATQATSSSQPTSGGSQNGLNTLLFTGKTMVLPTISLSTQTVFCVYLNTTFTPYGEPVELGPFAFFYAAPSSNVGIGRTGATDEVLANWSTNGLTTSKYTVYGGTVSVSGSTTSVLYFNGNQVASNTVASSGGQVYYRVGHYAGGTTGYIAEVIVFNSVLSTTQRRSVENYLMGKWGISNVTTHPFKNIPPSTSAPPQFQEVTPGNWTYDWQPYLSNLTRANNPANSTVIPTLAYGTGGASLSPALSTQGYIGGVLGPNGTIYGIPLAASNILMINTTTNGVSYGTGGPSLSPALATQYYYGGVLAPNGNIYCIPYIASNILMINTSTNGVSYGTGGPSLSPALSTQRYYGGVLAPNGTIYGIPWTSSNILMINTSDNSVKYGTGGPSLIPALSTQGYIGGVLGPNGTIYGMPNGSSNILMINTTTNGVSYGTGGPSLSPALATQYYYGGVLAPNGTIYCIPFSASNILMINTSNNQVSYGTGGPSLSPALSTQGYYGGVLAPNGNIYCIPRLSSNILIINTSTNGVSYGTGGPSLSPALSTQGYYGGVLAPNGTIYGIPGASNILRISNTYTENPSSNYCLSAWTNKF